MRFARACLFALVVAAVAGGASAQSYQDGLDAALAGDLGKAVSIWRPLASSGMTRAQFQLGRAYENGWGVPPDHVKAREWYGAAAGSGFAPAQRALAFLYEQGRGGPTDEFEALRLYFLAADQGDAAAQYTLGKLYSTGRIVGRDYAEAFKWLELAARQNTSAKPLASRDRDALAARMTDAERDDAEERLRAWRAG